MKVGDYVLYSDHAWVIITKHKRGTYQIKRLGIENHKHWENMEVSEGLCTVITKEVADVFIASNTHVTNN